MDRKQIITDFLEDVVQQNSEGMKKYFAGEAFVRWHNTNEHFSVEEYIRANCEYPGIWKGEVERIEERGDIVISVARVWSDNEAESFHVVSFFSFCEDKIVTLDEYWGDDGVAPQWRLNKHIGKPII